MPPHQLPVIQQKTWRLWRLRLLSMGEGWTLSLRGVLGLRKCMLREGFARQILGGHAFGAPDINLGYRLQVTGARVEAKRKGEARGCDKPLVVLFSGGKSFSDLLRQGFGRAIVISVRLSARIMTTPTPLALPPFSKGEFLATVDCSCSSRFEGTLVTPNDGATRPDREGCTHGLQ